MIGRDLKKFYVFLITMLASCGNSSKFDVDTSNISINIEHVNWLSAIDAKKPEAFLKLIKSGSGELGKYYLGTMIRVNPDVDSQCVHMLDLFLNYPSTIESSKEIKKVYADLSPVLKEIEEGFKHVKYYFPDTKNQTVYTYNSGFNFGVFPVGNEIGLGLEMYLGSDNKITKALDKGKFPQYIKDNMTPKNLIIDVFRGYSIMNLIPENQDEDLLGALVYQGKVLYALDAFLPNKTEYEKLRYTPEQLAWCEKFEKDIWKKIIDEKWLYSTSSKMISQFVNEAPFTSTLPQESPPRAGAWLGWQIVKAYANEHSDLSVKEILNEKNAKKILRSYRPK